MTCFCKRYLRLFHSCKRFSSLRFSSKTCLSIVKSNTNCSARNLMIQRSHQNQPPQSVVQKAVLTNHTANLLHESINAEELFQEGCYETWFKYLLYTDVLLQIFCIIGVCLKRKKPLIFVLFYFFSWVSVNR